MAEASQTARRPQKTNLQNKVSLPAKVHQKAGGSGSALSIGVATWPSQYRLSADSLLGGNLSAVQVGRQLTLGLT